MNASTARRPNPVHTAAASLQSVERALGDLRVTTSGGGALTYNPITAAPAAHRGRRGGHGGRRGRGKGEHHSHAGHAAGDTAAEPLTVPSTNFDFESSNARFDKAAAAAPHSVAAGKIGSENSADEAGSGAQNPAEKEKVPAPAYNPQKSFFDSLSSSAATGSGAGGSGPGSGGPSGHGGSGGRHGWGGRDRREEEREKNVATFGEPGRVGLLGPGGYVGGWGGYGRRGGRPRRGGGGGGAPPAVQARG